MNIACIYSRNEEENIGLVLEAVLNQTLAFDRVLYVDDYSTDASLEIVKTFPDVDIIRLKIKHGNWSNDPRLSYVANKYVTYCYFNDADRFMVIGADTVLSRDYNARCMEAMIRTGAVFVSGKITTEYSFNDFPRGTGLLVDFDFWRKYIGFYSLSYAWEIYPIYKALSLGFKVKTVENAHMRLLRATERFKSNYGYAMRELGYNPFYALARCGLAISKNPFKGFKMLFKYAIGARTFERSLRDYVSSYQRDVFFKRLTSKRSQKKVKMDTNRNRYITAPKACEGSADMIKS